MYKFLKNWISFLFILVFLSITSKSEASHLLGSEFTYEHIAGDTFLLKLKVYRDCHGINITASPFVVTPKGKSATNYSGKIYGGKDITPVCKTACTPCFDSSICSEGIGIKEYFIEAIVVLPECEYTISWEQCCRPGDITTGASGQNYYTEMTLNKCISGITSSPEFITKPYILGCINQCTTVLQGAVGSMGDSLSYKFGEPMGGATVPVTYNSGYSNEAPFKYKGYPNKNATYNYPNCNGVHINPNTGELNFKATDTDLTVMVILVEQWRKDISGTYQKVSTIRKDAVLYLVNCPPNEQPMISGIDSSNVTEIHICAKDTSEFIVYVKDDPKDTVTIKLTGNIPANALKLSQTQQQNVTFKWAPEEKHVRALPFWFVVRAEDNVCPVPSYLEKSFKVYVHSALTDINLSKKQVQCEDKYTFTSGISNKKGLYLQWKINDSIVSTDTALTYTFTKPGKYNIMLEVDNGNCSKSASDSVFVKEKLYINKNFTNTICKGDTLSLEAFAAHTYNWKPANYVSSNIGSTIKVFPDKTTTFYLSGKDTVTNCTKTDSVTIIVDTTCVWPGDANLDKTADYLDILDIALGYSASGIPRVNGSTDWLPQASKNWSQTLFSGINHKHLDTNGDSVIDTKDTLAIAKNYGKTHLKNEEPQLTGNPNDPPLFFQFDKKYYVAGETVKASLYLGNEDKPVKDIYGLGLKHFFAHPYMQTGTYNFTWNCDLLCGAKDNFQLYRQFNDKGTGEGSMIRTDKMTTSKPFGKIADIEFVLKDSTFSYPQTGANISLEILKSKLLDMNGNEIPVYTEAKEVKVYRSQQDVVGIKADVNANKLAIKVYPNPAKNIVYIDGGENRLKEVQIINMLGETVAAVYVKSSNATILTTALPAGIYFVRIQSANTFVQQKLVITR